MPRRTETTRRVGICRLRWIKSQHFHQAHHEILDTTDTSAMNDHKLRNRIERELAFDASLHALELVVSVKRGIVSLNGRLASADQHDSVLRAVARVQPNCLVHDELIVDAPANETEDHWLAERARELLAEDIELVPGSVVVTVRHGRATLTGHVQWLNQRRSAEESVRRLAALRGITNHLTIDPYALAESIKERICATLRIEADHEGERIKIDAAGDIITLRGEVHDEQERKLIEKAARAVEGVRVLDSRLKIAH